MRPLIPIAIVAAGLGGTVPVAAGNRALVIGIDDYTSVGRLAGSTNDATAMARFLEEVWRFAPDEIKLLLDSEATREGILTAIDDWLIAGTRPGDRVFLHYSGHGFYVADRSGDEADGVDEVIVAHNAIMRAGSDLDNIVLDDEIGHRLDRLKGREIVVVVDSCFSGTVTRAQDPDIDTTVRRTPQQISTTRNLRPVPNQENKPDAVDSKTGQVVWTAVSADQVALEDTEIRPRQGLFTNRFIRAIQDRAADRNGNGIVTYAEVLDYVRAESRDYCARHHAQCPANLVPTLEADPSLMGRDVVTRKADSNFVNQTDEMIPPDNPAGLSVRIVQGNRLKSGTPIQIELSAGQEGWLTLFDVRSDGRAIQILPNSFAGQQERLPADRRRILPGPYDGFKYSVTGRTGRGRIIAVLNPDRGVATPSRNLQPMAHPETEMGGFTAESLEPVDGGPGEPPRPSRISRAIFDYEVQP